MSDDDILKLLELREQERYLFLLSELERINNYLIIETEEAARVIYKEKIKKLKEEIAICSMINGGSRD